jgi:hypothetical protein
MKHIIKKTSNGIHRAHFLLMVVISATATVTSAQSPSPPNVEVAVSTKFLNKISTIPISQSQQVDMFVGGANISTFITANSVASISPWGTGQVGMGACVRANSRIDSNINAQVNGPLRINVASDAIGVTNASSIKCFFLDEAGLRPSPAATNATTKLTVTNLNVWAGGIFPRLKTRLGYRIAQQKLAEEIPKNEFEISNRAVAMINELLDTRTASMVAKVNVMWKEWVHDATTANKILPRAMKFFSTEKAAYMYVPHDDQPEKITLLPVDNEAIMVRVRPDYLRDIARAYLAGFTVTDIELLSVAAKVEGEYAIPEDVIGSADEVLMRFSGENPVSGTFENNTITLTLHFDFIETNGKTYKNVAISIPVVITADPAQGVRLALPTSVEVKEEASGEIQTELTEYVNSRWQPLLVNNTFSLEEIRRKMAPWLPLRFARATAKNGELTITAVNGEESEFSAISTKLTNMLVP